MATEPAEKAPETKGFEPVSLVRDGQTVIAQTAEQEAKLRWDGYRSAPSGKKSATPKPGPNPS